MKWFEALVNQLFAGARIEKATALTGGVSAEVHRLDLILPDATPVAIVVRAHGPRHSGHSAQLEYTLLRQLHLLGLPVPEPLFVDETRTISPFDFLALTFIDGTSEIGAAQAQSRVQLAARMLAQIHRQPIDALPALPRRIDPIPEVFEFWPEGGEWTTLAHYLKTTPHPSNSAQPCLLHGDFWPSNLIWQDNQIMAVLDWEDAALGDPMSDLAASRLEFRYQFGTEGTRWFTESYAKSQNIDWSRLALWQIYVAAAAQHFMSQWGLPEQQEAHMRAVARTMIREAGDALQNQSSLPC